MRVLQDYLRALPRIPATIPEESQGIEFVEGLVLGKQYEKVGEFSTQ